MSVSYDRFIKPFLMKISEYRFLSLPESDRYDTVDQYLKSALNDIKRVCKYDFISTASDKRREFNIDVNTSDLSEIIDIVSDGMVLKWMQPYVNQQELLEAALNTKDYTKHSEAELLYRIGNDYTVKKKDYIQRIREYSYDCGDLGDLHI